MAPLDSPTDRPLHLLLLSPFTQSPSWQALKAAYEPAIAAILKQLSNDRRQAASGAVLEIALPVVSVEDALSRSTTELYPHVQRLVAGAYRLICLIATRDGVNMEDAKGIDVRVLLLAHGDKPADGKLVKPIVDIKTLAQSARPWQDISALEGEDGDALVREFVINQDGHVNIRRYPAGKSEGQEQSSSSPSPEDSKLHASIAVGGTFDHVHVGHKLLLTMFAFLPAAQNGQTRSLTIGITGDELLKKKKYAEVLESWDERQAFVADFLRSIVDFRPAAEPKTETRHEPGPNGHAVDIWFGDDYVAKCVELSDPFGPTITDEGISALVISAETRSGGKAVNDKRRDKGWAELAVFEVDVLEPDEGEGSGQGGESFESKLSSTTIRKAIVERQQAAK